MSSLITFTSQYSEESEAKIPENEFCLTFFCETLFLLHLCSSLVSSCLKDLQDFVAQL